MRRSYSSLRMVLIAAWITTVPVSQASAQLLDLDVPKAPAPGEGKAAAALADTVQRQVDLRLPAALASADAESAAARVQVSFRRLCVALARKGESNGEAGTLHLLAAWTLANGSGALDRVADRLAGVGADQPAPADAKRVIDALFDRTGRLQIQPPPDSASDLDAWLHGVLGELAAVAKADGTGDSPSARDAALVERIGRQINHLPDWVGVPVREALQRRHNEAALAITADDTAARARLVLRQIGADCETAGALDRVSQVRAAGSVRAIEGARKAVAGALASGRKDLPAVAARAATVLRERRIVIGMGEISLIREARPAWRLMEATARRAESQVWDVLAAAPARLEKGDATADPAIVAVIAAVRRSNDEMRSLRAASDLLREDSDKRAVDADTLAAKRVARMRLLRLGQATARPPTRDPALAVIRDLGSVVLECSGGPAEESMRHATEAAPADAPVDPDAAQEADAWKAAAGDHTADLLAALQRTRTQWLQAWSKEPTGMTTPLEAGESGAAASKLRNLTQATADAWDAVTLRLAANRLAGGSKGAGGEGSGRFGAQSQPGWELSARAMRALADEASERSARIVSAALAEDSERLAAARKGTDGEGVLIGKVAALAARLDRAALEHRRETGDQSWDEDVLAEVLAIGGLAQASGVAGQVEVADGAAAASANVPDLAVVCRYLEEWAVARGGAAGDRKRARSLLEYIAIRADAAMRELHAAK